LLLGSLEASIHLLSWLLRYSLWLSNANWYVCLINWNVVISAYTTRFSPRDTAIFLHGVFMCFVFFTRNHYLPIQHLLIGLPSGNTVSSVTYKLMICII
jgi:hypothetical protein